MYQTIIVPVDVSHADKAGGMLDVAKRLGGRDAKIVLLNVQEDIPNYIAVQMPGGFQERARASATEELGKIAEATDLETETEVRVGHASQEILSLADEKKADAIIIASHRPGLEDYLLGSTAARVVRHANCTVVVLR